MSMQDWLRLEKDLTRWLRECSGKGLTYKGPNQCIVGFPSDGFRSDRMLTDDASLLAIEVEASQQHPDTNVGKYWLLYQSKKYTRIVLFHIFTPKFNSYPWRKALADFYVERMKPEVPIEYIMLDYRKATDYDNCLASVKARISEKIVETFGPEYKPSNSVSGLLRQVLFCF